jgi:hypothetical protein
MRSAAPWTAVVLVIAIPTPALAQTPEPTPTLPAPAPTAAPAPTPALTPAPAPASPPPPSSEPSISPGASTSEATPHHDGLYVRVASGIGFMSLWGDGPAGSASISGLQSVAILAVGGSPVRGFAIAGAFWGGVVNSNTFNGGPFDGATLTTKPMSGAVPHSIPASTNATGSLGGLGVLVDWYPSPAGGWHAGASVGLGLVGVTTLADNASMGGVGFGASLFGGYDWWIGRNWSLGLMLVAAGANRASLTDTNRNDTGYRLMPLSIGIAASILYY